MANITFSIGSGLNDSVFGKSQEPIQMFIEKKAEAFEAESMLPHLFHMGTSTHWGEKFASMTGMDGFKPVGEGGAYPVDGMQESYSKFLEHMTWKDSFPITREMVEDGKLMDMKSKPASFIAGWYRTREKFGSALYAGAVSGKAQIEFMGKKFDATSADKMALFAKEHPSKLGKAKQCNLFSDAFSNAALGAMESRMQDFRGDAGEVLTVAPNTIMIPNDYALKQAVFAAIGADKDPDTANNGFNYNFGRWTVVVNPYLNEFLASGVKPWILLDSRYNEENGGAVWLDRTGLDVRSEIAANDDNLWKGYGRYIAGFNDWRFAAVGGISGGTALVG